MAKEEKKEEKKVKRPSAQKRDLQSEKRRFANKVYKSQVRSAIRTLQENIDKKDEASSKTALNAVYSLLDKCVKKGIFKRNKASRTKSRLAARAAAGASTT